MAIKVKKEEKTPTKGEAQPSASVPARSSQHPLLGLRQEIDRLFDDFFRGALRPFGWPGFGRDWPRLDLEPFRGLETTMGAMVPRVDIAETDKEFQVTAELPGMDEKDIEVALADGVLKIKGEKKAEKTEEGKDFLVSERHYGSFQRAFRVPDSVDQDKVSANFEKGILKVVLQKSAKARDATRKITIKTK